MDNERSIIKTLLAIVGVVVVIAGIAYAVYKFFFEDQDVDFLDDIDDAFDDDDPFEDVILDD